MFEINIDNNSPRISLARASQLTGYHQDYLGQLCRLGKLQAQKVGRNWFTSADALNELFNNESSPLASIEAEVPIIESPEVVRPVIAPNISVNELEGFPVRIVTIPTRYTHTNNVQNILTNSRIENLQSEVLELRRLLFKLMEEVKSQAMLLQAQQTISRAQDSLKHSYVSNFDFNVPAEASQGLSFIPENQAFKIHFPKSLNRRYELADWFAAVSAVGVIVLVAIALIGGSFFGSGDAAQTVYVRPAKAPAFSVQEIQPTVAGAETPAQAPTAADALPTDSAGELIPNVIQ